MMFIPSLKMIFQYISHIFHIVSPVFQLFYGFLTHPHPGFLFRAVDDPMTPRGTIEMDWHRQLDEASFRLRRDAKMLSDAV